MYEKERIQRVEKSTKKGNVKLNACVIFENLSISFVREMREKFLKVLMESAF
jgi:hypothetical protein